MDFFKVGPGRRIAALVAVVVLLTVISSLTALLTARKMERLMDTIVSENLPGAEAATELQKALLQQRGLVTAYMLDEGRLAWVNDLDRIRPILAARLERARRTARSEDQRHILSQLAGVYASYDQERERAISLYRAGRKEEAREALLGDASRLADQANDLCRQLVTSNEAAMQTSLREGQQRVALLTLALATGVGLAISLGFGLLFLIFQRLVLPVRRMARDARALQSSESNLEFPDEMRELEHWQRVSRDRLVVAEKLAAVGQFAAVAAHEIRSPLTSMKMWLYQLREAGRSNPEVERSRLVLEEEIGRLDELATSFLQYSRPPKLSPVKQCIGSIIDRTLELARHHLDARNVRVTCTQKTPLPAVLVDAHQMRQVVLNLVTNAAEASPAGGTVQIIETEELSEGGGREVVVRIQDDGPGIAEGVRERIFEPFVTTKRTGSGLGLSVAASILRLHGGRLILESTGATGTVFALRIPATAD